MSSATGPKGKQILTQKDKNYLEIHRHNVPSSRITERNYLQETAMPNVEIKQEVELLRSNTSRNTNNSTKQSHKAKAICVNCHSKVF